MTRLLVVNAGSSTLKLSVVVGDIVVAEQVVDDWDGTAEPRDARSFVDAQGDLDAVGHRVVHGGFEFDGAVVIDDAVLDRIRSLIPLAPLHQPRALRAIELADAWKPDITRFACFDTAFHRTLPPAARTYALPSAWRSRWDIQRYGFHGLSHAWSARRAPEIAGIEAGESVRVVSCHLGAGASLCAVRDRVSVDTTMGFTPLEGLVMATRSGSVDPGIVLWLQTEAGLSAEMVAYGLEHESGLAGLSGSSGDFRDVLDARASGDVDAALAFDVYVHQLGRGIGAMAASARGLDVLSFTGGIGEHSSILRASVCDRLAFLGVAIDVDRNDSARADASIGADGARVRTVVVSAREDREIAAQVEAVLGA